MNNQSLMSEVQQNHPNTPLSNKDIVLLLMDHCQDSIRNERGYIKEIINEKADTVVTGLTRGLCEGLARLTEVIKDQSIKIADLELKIETLTSFNEQSLLHHMQNSLPCPEDRRVSHDCSVCIRNPTVEFSNGHMEHYHCNSCITVFKSVKELYFHQCTPHAKFTLEVCWKCGDTFDGEKLLVEHISNMHGEDKESNPGSYGEAINTCNSCDLTYQTENILALHHTSSHAPMIHNQISMNEPVCNFYGHPLYAASVDQLAMHGNNHVSQSELESSNHQDFTTHIQNTHGHHIMSTCETCGILFTCHENLLSHKCSQHSMYQDLHCNYCDSTFHEMRLLNIHIRDHHTNSSCDPCEKISSDQVDLKSHPNYKHAAPPGCIPQLDGDWDSDSDVHVETEEVIAQFDGNTTLGDMEVSEDDPELLLLPANSMESSISVPTPAYQGTAAALLGHQAVHNPDTSITNTQINHNTSIQYNYNLNKVNQTKRLLENSLRSPVQIRHGNYQNINGIKHPTSVTLDFNSGVYLAVIKPALENITEGWNTEMLQTVISCEEVSPRTDISGRKVCTKLVMYLTESNQRNKAVLHFYHTSSTLQVQGSSLMTSGSPTPVWFVDNFIQPLTAKYSDEHQDSITEINTNIQQSVSSLCVSCNLPINPTATKPKDQELACSRCGNLFHKKCTDRWKTTGGWRRTPWYCPSCITSTPSQVLTPPRSSITDIENIEPDTQHIIQRNLPQVPLHTPTHMTVGSTHVVPTLTTRTLTASTTQTTSTPATTCMATSSTRSALCTLSNSIATITTGSVTTSLHNLPTSTGLPPTVQPSFPSATTRQRSTNININNAELEFQRTALNACRSTVSQQEAEIKRLKETLEIRNKRIIQLEAVVGHAADTVAARDSPPAHTSISENNCKVLADKVDEISKKLEQLRASGSYPSNNIVINSCNTGGLHSSRQNSFTQTEETHVTQQAHPEDAQAHPEQDHAEQDKHEQGPDRTPPQNTL